MLPEQGVSAIDRAGQPFDDPEARAALIQSIQRLLPAERIIVLPRHINDPEFARAAAEKLLELMRPGAAAAAP